MVGFELKYVAICLFEIKEDLLITVFRLGLS